MRSLLLPAGLPTGSWERGTGWDREQSPLSCTHPSKPRQDPGTGPRHRRGRPRFTPLCAILLWAWLSEEPLVVVPKSGRNQVPQGGSEASGLLCPPGTGVEGGAGGRTSGLSPSPSPGLGTRQRPPPRPAPRGLPEALQVEGPDPAESPRTPGPWATAPPCPHPQVGRGVTEARGPHGNRRTRRRALGAQSAGWLSPLREAGQVGAPGGWARAGEAGW